MRKLIYMYVFILLLFVQACSLFNENENYNEIDLRAYMPLEAGSVFTNYVGPGGQQSPDTVARFAIQQSDSLGSDWFEVFSDYPQGIRSYFNSDNSLYTWIDNRLIVITAESGEKTYIRPEEDNDTVIFHSSEEAIAYLTPTVFMDDKAIVDIIYHKAGGFHLDEPVRVTYNFKINEGLVEKNGYFLSRRNAQTDTTLAIAGSFSVYYSDRPFPTADKKYTLKAVEEESWLIPVID